MKHASVLLYSTVLVFFIFRHVFFKFIGKTIGSSENTENKLIWYYYEFNVRVYVFRHECVSCYLIEVCLTTLIQFRAAR
jgi:hypothetical protein